MGVVCEQERRAERQGRGGCGRRRGERCDGVSTWIGATGKLAARLTEAASPLGPGAGGDGSGRKVPPLSVVLPAVLPAVSGSASRFLTRSDVFGSALWPITTGFSEFLALARTDYESVALRTELRWRTTAPRRTMQQRIVNRTPQTALMTRAVGSSWTSASCRAVPRMRFHLFECGDHGTWRLLP